MVDEFLISTSDEIKKGLVTDAYFVRTEEILRKAGENPQVVMELFLKFFPNPDYLFGVFLGVSQIAHLLEGLPVSVSSMEEGEIFFPTEPVLSIEGNYTDFARYETAIIGFISFLSGIASKAARMRIAAGKKEVLSFGTRRQHPALAPSVEYASYVGGLDGVSNVLGAEYLGIKPSGTMPHSLILVLGNNKKAFKYFHDYIDSSVPRIALVDTFASPVIESQEALEMLGDNLLGIRLDSKDYVEHIAEIKWIFKQKGANGIKIYMSGGLDEYEIERLHRFVDGFGIGTRLSSAPVLDFALKIVEVNKKPMAKVGNLPGAKMVYRNNLFQDMVRLKETKPPENYLPLLKPLLDQGKIVRGNESIQQTREKLLHKLENLPEELKLIKNGKPYRVEFKP